MRIGVVGAGVAGGLFAAAAIEAGVDVEVFEQIQRDERDAAGTGLNIGPNAMIALERHGGMETIAEGLIARALPWRRWGVELTDGRPIVEIDIQALAGRPGLRIRWADLYAVMRDACARRTSYGLAIEALEEAPGGGLVAVFRSADGARERHGPFDLIVAADGRYSALRASLLGKPAPSFPGIGTWRLLVPAGGECPIDDYKQYFCGNARLLSFRTPGDEVYVAGSFPLAGEGPMPDFVRTSAAQRGYFEPPGAAASREVAWMLDQFEANIGQVNWARTQMIDPVHSALEGRVLFLGDAAHAMYQTLGQGATQSVEDALVAAALLRRGAASPAALCEAYVGQRGDRVAFAKAFSEEATDTLLPGADPVAGSLKKAEPPFLEKLRRLYTDVA